MWFPPEVSVEIICLQDIMVSLKASGFEGEDVSSSFKSSTHKSWVTALRRRGFTWHRFNLFWTKTDIWGDPQTMPVWNAGCGQSRWFCESICGRQSLKSEVNVWDVLGADWSVLENWDWAIRGEWINNNRLVLITASVWGKQNFSKSKKLFIFDLCFNLRSRSAVAAVLRTVESFNTD